MVRSGCSRLASDDERFNKALNRKFGHRFTKVEVDDLKKVFGRRGRRDVDDSMKDFEYNRGLSDVDPDYLESLTSDPMWKNQDKKAVDIDADDIDPQYEMFWSCLKPHGNFCVLEVSENNGLSAPIIYGADESDDELPNQKAEWKWKDVVTEPEIEEKNRGRSAFTTPISSKDPCSNEDVVSVNSKESDSLHRVDIATNGRRRYALRTNSTLIDSKKEESDNDDDYAWYLASDMIRQDGPDRNMLVCKANEHGRDNANSRKGGKRYALRCSGNVIKTKKVEAGVVSRKNDEYENCFTGLRPKGSKAISRDRPDLKVEEDDTSLCISSYHGEINSDFRMELIKILRRPYNASEHRKLTRQVNARNKVDRHIDLRHGRAASYAGKKRGKSYLDQHSGLQRKLEEFKDDESKELNLLRGFFFWLQNLTWENAFSPWRDQASLAVLPQPVSKRTRQISNSEFV